MDEPNPLSYLILILLLCLAAYFAVCETAFASVSRIRVKAEADKNNRRAVRALSVLERFDTAITTILIGTNIVHLTAAAYVTVLVTRHLGLGFVALSTILTTVALFFFGEMLPKSIAKKYSERFALATAGSLCFFMRIFAPISHVLSAFGNGIARLTKGDPEVTVTEDELYDIIETMRDEGELDDDRGDLVQSALMFADVTVESILTARVDVDAVNIEDSPEEILALIRGVRHSRLPVYRDSIDNIIGVLQIRKYIRAWLREGPSLDVEPLLDKAYFVHQSANIDELLPVMSRNKLNMAVVTDNYGGTLGIVTIEDILEELVGEIWDEEDEVVESFVRLPDGSVRLSPELDIEEAFELLEYDDPEDTDWEHKLLGEWAYEHFDLLPTEGDAFRYHDLEFTVTAMRQHRITELTVRLLPEEVPEGGEAE